MSYSHPIFSGMIWRADWLSGAHMKTCCAALLSTAFIAAVGTPAPASATPVFSFSINKSGTNCPNPSSYSYPASDKCVSGSLTVTNDSTDWSIVGLAVGVGAFDAAEAEIDPNATPPVNTDWGSTSLPWDFSFATRIEEEEGIYYFFNHADGGHTLQTGTYTGFDFNLSYANDLPIDPPLEFDATNGVQNVSCTATYTFGQGEIGGCDPPTTVPEPPSLALLGTGLVLAYVKRRRKPV